MTKVCFRKDEGSTDVVAVFPQIPWNDSCLTCYEHYGQHGPCTADWVRYETRPATKEEYEPLLRELTELVGYDDLKVLPRMPRVPNRFYGV
jgi:hypothetical protein